MNFYFLIMTLFCAMVLMVSMRHDSRRFRNGVFLLMTVLSAIVWFVVFLSEHDAYSAALIILLSVVIIISLIVPAVLIMNGIVMIRREGRSLQNILSLLFGIIVIAGFFALVRAMYHFDLLDRTQQLSRIPLLLIGYGIFYGSLVFLAFLFYTWLIKVIPLRKQYRYVIVLGAGLLDGDRVSKLLSDRIDKGIHVFNKAGDACQIICSGGQGSDETITEAEAMKRYLVEHGIEEERILKEEHSTTTQENLMFSKELIEQQGETGNIAVITSGYHVLRALIYSRKISLQCDGIGAHTALYYWPSAMICEFAALMKYYWLPFVLFFLITAGYLLYVLHIFG